MDVAEAYLRLALIPGLGPITAQRLLDAAEGDPARVFSWSMSRLQSIDGVGGERARRICDPRLVDELAREIAEAKQMGIRIITREESDYPKDLLTLADPPLALWVQGELAPRDRLAIAIVGPRRPSAYGHRQAVRFAGGLARIGATVVSGLARGVDTAAHQASLEAQGRTIAVIGSGFAKLYPDENRGLAERIAAGNGAVMSEFPLRTPPSPGTFPRRNRIVAALSLATLVIEAGAQSGALITARLAGELGRSVLCLPGNIDNTDATGSNRLIRDGATLITSLDDVIEEIAPLATLARATPEAPAQDLRVQSLSGREKQLYQMLNDQARTIDDLARVGSIPVSAVSATLLSLELRRLAKRSDGGFVRAL
jgi:DNA processing protein